MKRYWYWWVFYGRYTERYRVGIGRTTLIINNFNDSELCAYVAPFTSERTAQKFADELNTLAGI